MACTAVPIFPELAYNWAVVKGSGNKGQIKDGGEERKQKTAQRYYLRPIPNDWHYF
jgi:hypothetical protein